VGLLAFPTLWILSMIKEENVNGLANVYESSQIMKVLFDDKYVNLGIFGLLVIIVTLKSFSTFRFIT
jgi:hypothetical protein